MNIHVTEYERTRDMVLEELEHMKEYNMEDSIERIRKIFKLRDLMIAQEEKKQEEFYETETKDAYDHI